MEIEKAFGQTLKELRVKAGLSQEALTLECDLDRTYISLLERGLRQPTLKSLFKIADILHPPPPNSFKMLRPYLKNTR
jgi:transcriptional regulator with XRE-family HTH domain